jgi:hypothetical protein
MNSDTRDELIHFFGVACDNINSAIEKLNSYHALISSGTPTTDETVTKANIAVMRAKENTMRALGVAKEYKLHEKPDMRTSISMLKYKIIDMESAFDEANEEEGDKKLVLIEKAITHAGFAKKNCDDVYKNLVNMPTNKGGSYKRKNKRTHRNKRTYRNRKRTHHNRK